MLNYLKSFFAKTDHRITWEELDELEQLRIRNILEDQFYASFQARKLVPPSTIPEEKFKFSDYIIIGGLVLILAKLFLFK